MKRFVTTCAVIAAFTAAGPAAAQTFGFGAHAGVSLPMGDYGDAASTGFSAGLDLTYPLLMVVPGLNWYTSADVVAHSAKEELVTFDPDGGFLYVPIMTGLLYEFPAGPVRPFVNAQGGIVLSKGPDSLTPAADAELGTDFGFAVGGGARIGQNFYVGLKYYPINVSYQYADYDGEPDVDTDFLDIYVGFGVF